MVKVPPYSVDKLSEGEILVRGTLDPVMALKYAFEEVDGLGLYNLDEALCDLYGLTLDYQSAEITPEAVSEFADYLYLLIERAHCRYWRKVNSLPNSDGEAEGWAWSLHPALKGSPGAFPAVEFL